MSRPLRIEYPGAWYHVMNRGANFKKIFTEDADRDEFLKLLGETCEMWRIRVHAFCLMDNHYHLLVETPTIGLARAMRHLNGVYTQRFNRKKRRDGALFRGRYRAILVQADNYLMEIVRYIHMNPAKRREDIHALMNYRWSSNYYYLGKKVKPEWLETSKILNLFSTNRRQQKALYKEFISDRIPDEIKKIYSRKKLSPVIGDDSFKEWIKKTFLERKAAEYEIPEAGKRETGPPAEQIVDIVKAWYKVEDQDLKCRRRGIRNEPRQVAVFLCRQMSGLSLNEIKILFDMGAYTTASMAIQSIKNRLTVEQRFRRRIEKIKKKILDAT